ncbi:MAG: radical SAM protein [Leptolyngbyaceae cyanobacterium bins.59]|nr:radical SAM protein [Leptolyngbyaceae cyanobacterium bins.59]
MATQFSPVYGPVTSWRYGRSLGIDPIGPISTCSFNCVYCQLGAIEQLSHERQVFLLVDEIKSALKDFTPWEVDVITLSGSGEPTLALNLGEILEMVKTLTHRPVTVLTNGTLLHDPNVCRDLEMADRVAIKIDAVSTGVFQRINRPLYEEHPFQIWEGIAQLKQTYQGHLAIQTMVLTEWSDPEQVDYIHLIQQICPHEIQLNTPNRPRPLTHQLDARGNHTPDTRPYPVQQLRTVNPAFLKTFGDRIHDATGIPVRYAPIATSPLSIAGAISS